MTRVLITGANRGIGLALARALTERGAFVFAGARRGAQASGLEQLQQCYPDRLARVTVDVTDSESVRRAVGEVTRVTTALDVLVNNAGVLLEPIEVGIEELEVGLFDRTFAVNVTGVVRVTQAFLPLLRQSESPRIINVSSGAGSLGTRSDHCYTCYGASKAALNHWTLGLAHELRPRGIVVAALSPGWVRTDMGGGEAELAPEEAGDAIADTLLKLDASKSGCFLDRFGNPGRYGW